MAQEPSNSTAVPLSWREVWLRVLTQPSELSFQSILADPTATKQRAYTWIAVVTLIEALIGLVLRLPSFTQANLPANAPADFAPTAFAFSICLVPIAPLVAVLGLIISVAITEFIAKLLGGLGSYDGLTYATAAYSAPLGLIGWICGFVPFAPTAICLSSMLGIYTLILSVTAVKAVNRFSWGKAVLSLFIIPLIVFGCILIGVLSTLTSLHSPR